MSKGKVVQAEKKLEQRSRDREDRGVPACLGKSKKAGGWKRVNEVSSSGGYKGKGTDPTGHCHCKDFDVCSQ